MRRSLRPAWLALMAVCAIGAACLNPTVAQAQTEFNGPEGGEIKFKDDSIKLVDGDGNWIIWGKGQDLTINEKNGNGNLTLKGFGKITIKQKNGRGTLTIEDDNKAVHIHKVDGPGNVILRNKGDKDIDDKNGPGDVLFKGEPPSVTKKDGTGKVKREE